METEVTKVIQVQNLEGDVTLAAEIIQNGGVVAFPTETVYGLGANALDAKAVQKIFAAKGRPADNPLIVHISDWAMLQDLVGEIPAQAKVLAEHFWPGPLTMVLPKSPGLSDQVTAGLSTVAVRMPDHPVALKLIELAGLPIAAPSANTSGRPSPTLAQHVWEDLRGKVEMILDGGQVGVGVESTVLDLTTEQPMILRPGGVTAEEISAVLGEKVMLDPALDNNKQGNYRPKAPGMKYKHYAPKAPVYIYSGEVSAVVEAILHQASELTKQGRRVGIMPCTETADLYQDYFVLPVGARKQLATVAANLYAVLRKFDHSPVDIILAEGYPEEGIGLAIMNRLRKAAGNQVALV